MTFIKLYSSLRYGNRDRIYGQLSHTNVVGENTVLQLNILETGVLTLVVQNSSPTRLRLVGDEF